MFSEEKIRIIHDSKTKAVIAITGGGTDAIGNLLRFGGGSSTLLEAVVPYDQGAFRSFVGGTPEKYCSPDAARDLAMAAFMRARKLSSDRVVGVGATCSLAKGGEERVGRRHEAHIAVQTSDATYTRNLRLPQGKRTRVQEEEYISDSILEALCFGCGVEHLIPEEDAESEGTTDLAHGCSSWYEVLTGELPYTIEWLHKPEAEPENYLIFPGSFNPLHEDHVSMLEEAARITGSNGPAWPVYFEISLNNVDKLPLNYHAIWNRILGLKQSGGAALLLTNAPTFEQKAKLFKGKAFIVGFDTIERIGDPKYYGNSESDMYDSLYRLGGYGTKFLVFHRKRNGVVSTQQDFHDKIPIPLRKLCTLVSTDQFMPQGYASSEIRKAKGAEYVPSP